jgi:hypothetical protein
MAHKFYVVRETTFYGDRVYVVNHISGAHDSCHDHKRDAEERANALNRG